MNEAWMQLIGLIGVFIGNAGLIVWFRTESRNDWHKMDTEMKDFRQIMYAEMKDFHGRLCAIEEKRLAQEKK